MTGHAKLAIAIVGLALGARVVAAAALGNSFHFADETAYVDTARRLLTGDGFGIGYHRVPAYPVILAALAAPLPAELVLLRAAQAVVTAAGCVLIFILALQMFGAVPALAAALMYALDPVLVVAGSLLYPETIAAALLIPTVLFAWHAGRSDRLAFSTAVGMLLGILVQLRPVSLVLLPVLAPWIALTTVPWKRRAAHTAVLVLGLLLTLLPWTVRNYQLHGRVIPLATAGTNLAPVPDSEVRRHGLVVSLVLAAWEEPGAFARRVAREFGHFWEPYPMRLTTDSPERRVELHQRDPRLPTRESFPRSLRDTVSAITFGLEICLALVGVVAAWRWRRRETVLLALTILAYALGYTLFNAKLRYRIPVLPLLFVLAGVGVATLHAAIGARWSRHARV